MVKTIAHQQREKQHKDDPTQSPPDDDHLDRAAYGARALSFEMGSVGSQPSAVVKSYPKPQAHIPEQTEMHTDGTKLVFTPASASIASDECGPGNRIRLDAHVHVAPFDQSATPASERDPDCQAPSSPDPSANSQFTTRALHTCQPTTLIVLRTHAW